MEKQASITQSIFEKHRSLIISIAGKVLHILISGGNKSLENTGQQYLQRTGTTLEIDQSSQNAIDEFILGEKGIIIINHKSGIFPDYLPLMATLGDTVLKNCIIYTGTYNLSMNQREFPEYAFRPAIAESHKHLKKIYEGLLRDSATLAKDGGYLFLIPAGDTTDENAPFLGGFRKLIKTLPDDFPVLVCNVQHSEPISYKTITQALFKLLKLGETAINAKLSSVDERKNEHGRPKTGEEMSLQYTGMFNT